jgi:hypothetical protein
VYQNAVLLVAHWEIATELDDRIFCAEYINENVHVHSGSAMFVRAELGPGSGIRTCEARGSIRVKHTFVKQRRPVREARRTTGPFVKHTAADVPVRYEGCTWLYVSVR